MMQACALGAVLNGGRSGRDSDQSKSVVQGVKAQTRVMLVLEGNAGTKKVGVEIQHFLHIGRA